KVLLPILIATQAQEQAIEIRRSSHGDGVIEPVSIAPSQLRALLDKALTHDAVNPLQVKEWESGGYTPTPTIVEAALALYGGHNVGDILNRGAENLSRTVDAVQEIVRNAKDNHEKAICFVTGVPGAGKTLVGLDIATQNMDPHSELYSVYLSGNGPLVKVLQEALAMD